MFSQKSLDDFCKSCLCCYIGEEMSTKINFDIGIVKKINVNSFKNILVLTGTQYSLEIFEKQIASKIKTKYHVFHSIPASLTDNIVYSVLNYCYGKKIDCIITVGPGSVMNCGRLISLLLSHGGFLHDYVPGGTLGPYGVTGNMLYHITVPTMPAAGYEITNNVEVKIGAEKHIISSPNFIPQETYIDPQIMTNLPSDLWAVNGFDCFATALMAYVSRYANPTSDEYAMNALNTYLKYSGKLLKDPNNIEYIKQMCTASMNSFLATNFSSVGAIHAITHAVAAKFGFRFGTALAILAAEVCDYCYDSNKNRFDEITKMLGGKNIKQAIKGLIGQMDIKVPSIKKQLDQSILEKLAYASMNPAMQGNAKELAIEDVITILRRLP